MNTIPERPLAGFERRLLDALTEIDSRRPPTVTAVSASPVTAPAPLATAAVPAARHRPHRMRLALIATSAVALVAAGAFATAQLAGPGTGHSRGGGQAIGSAPVVRPAAFTVRVNGDGSVSFTASDLVDPAAATKALNDAGVAGKVVNNTNGCGAINASDLAPGFVRGPRPRPRPSLTGPPAGIVTDGNTVTVRSSDYPAGGGVLVVVQLRDRPGAPWAAVLSWAYADAGHIPNCVDVTDPGTD